MAKKRLLGEIIVLVAAVAVTSVLSSLVTAHVIRSGNETTATTAPTIVESYEVSDPVKLNLGNLDDITSITARLVSGTKEQGDKEKDCVQAEGEDRDRIINFLKSLMVVKLRDSRGISGWDYELVLYNGEEQRHIVGFLYSPFAAHPEWVVYGSYIYYIENMGWDAVENLLSPYFE